MFRMLFLFLLLSMGLSAQDFVTLDNAPKSAIKLYEKAEKYLSENKKDQAVEKLNQAIEKAPNFIDAYLKLGGINYEQGNFNEAIENFQIGYQLDSTHNIRVIQALALTYEQVENYDKSIYYFEKYIDQNDKLKPEYIAELKKKIKDFQFRKEALKNPVPFDPKPLPATINNPKLSEYSPSLTADGNRLFFTRVSSNQEDIYYTEKDSSGNWKEAAILPNLNTLENEGAHNISADGKVILFTFCSDGRTTTYRGCNIFVSFKRDGKWSSPQYFEAINSKAWDTQPNISSDGNTIIFVSKRPGGFGESDLWWSKRNEENKWEVPVNLGLIINTPYREESPFLHPDGKTLFFKSEGHPGMGSFDLFKSELSEDGTWSKPENLGYPINTADHEGAMVVSLNGKDAFYSRGNGKVGFDRTQSDIYTFELPEAFRAKPVGFVNFRVLDDETKLPLSAVINVQSTNGETRKLITDDEGSKILTLPLGFDYSLNIEKENYYFYSERFELEQLNTAETAFEIDVYLKKIEVVNEPEPVVLKNVLFESGSYELKTSSFFELDQLVQLLNSQEEIKIEIRGHTDDVGENEANLILSENRAKAVKEYLVSKGISKDRLTFVGFGESKPISDNSSEEGRKINRRTEFIIIK